MELQHIDVSDSVIYAVPSKEGIKTDAERLISSVTEGLKNPIDVAIRLKYAQSVIEEAQKGIKDTVITEIGKYAKGERIDRYGAEIKTQEAGVSYDYSNCNHPKYEALVSRLEKVKEEMKELETFLKSLKGATVICNDDTLGESVEVYPPVKKSTTSVIVKFA